MRDTLKVDDAYYISHQTDYSAFADAVMDVGPAPCTKFDCPRQKECAEEAVECKAFRFWTNNGGFETFRKGKGMVSIEDQVGKLLQTCK